MASIIPLWGSNAENYLRSILSQFPYELDKQVRYLDKEIGVKDFLEQEANRFAGPYDMIILLIAQVAVLPHLSHRDSFLS